MKRSKLILLGLAVFAITALLQLPADRFHTWILTRAVGEPVVLQGLSGTLSSGRAAQIDVQGQPVVQNVDWQLQALRLLMGRASFRLSGGREGTLVDGTAYLVPSGALTLADFRLGAPIKSVLAAAGQPFLPFEGQADLDLASLKLRQGWPAKADGLLTLRGLSWKLGREPVLFGDYEAKFENETGGVKATVRSLSGPLEVSGEGRVLDDRSYEMNLQLRARPDAPPMVPNLVRNLGQPDAQGWYHLRRRGNMSGTPPAAVPEMSS